MGGAEKRHPPFSQNQLFYKFFYSRGWVDGLWKSYYDFTCHPGLCTCDSQSIHIPLFVRIASYGSSPPYFNPEPFGSGLKYYRGVGMRSYAQRFSLSACRYDGVEPSRETCYFAPGGEVGVRLPIIFTIHYHVSGKIKENTGIAKLYLLCRCSLF